MNPLLFLVVAQAASKPAHPVAVQSLPDAQMVAPITAKEAREAFARVYEKFTKVTRLPLGTPIIPVADRPATRGEIVKEMSRAYRVATPAVRFTPAPMKFNDRYLKIEASARPTLMRLITLGFVGKVAPLAVGPTSGISAKDFGDALGFFASRLGQVSHLPSSRWTPMLQTDN